MLTSRGLLLALNETRNVLAGATVWLLAGTGLTLAIALLRGLRREVRALVLALRS